MFVELDDWGGAKVGSMHCSPNKESVSELCYQVLVELSSVLRFAVWVGRVILDPYLERVEPESLIPKAV
jgi:hypothetical protein